MNLELKDFDINLGDADLSLHDASISALDLDIDLDLDGFSDGGTSLVKNRYVLPKIQRTKSSKRKNQRRA